MFEGRDQAIYDLLAERRLIDPSLLQQALADHRSTGRSFASTLLELNALGKSELLRAVAEHTGCDFTGQVPVALSAEILALVEGRLAHAYGVMPVATDGPTVSLLAADPFGLHLASDLAFVLGRQVRLAVADPGLVRQFIRRHYGEDNAMPGGGFQDLPAVADEATLSEADIEQLAGQTPIISFVNRVLTQAIRDRTSDIHFEPFEREFKIRARIDGALYEMPSASRNLALPIISRLKVLASLNIAERRLPQDGRITLTVGGRAVDLRVSTLPTQFGESVVLRVLDQASIRLELGQLGLPGPIRSQVEEIIRRPSGIFLVTGPTGSGKTTTLYSCLKALNTLDAKLLTVEDPVEYEIDGVMQVPVNLPAGLTFARALRTFLRQDPDIVMVGEIRDLETAQIAIQASLTGHLVLSTLHTNDAPGAATRLVDMGIAPFLLASTLEAVLAQRLVRRICPSCKTAFKPAEALLRQIGADPAALQDRLFFTGRGCPACGHTGYKGRLGLFEFLRMTEALRELVVRGASLVELRQKALEEGMTPLRGAGWEAILAGETTVEEVIKYT